MNFIAMDFETAKYSRESACAVGLVRFRDGKAQESFYSLIRPPILYIRPDFTDIHGITVDDVEDAPTFEELWETDILPFIGDLPLAAHNAPFDMGILQSVLEWYELPIPALNYFCTLMLSRNVWPRLKSHSLPNLGAHFGIVYEAHNALDDAHTCGDIACLAAEKTGSADLKSLLHAARVGMKVLA
ncbi:DNA polymerase III subunit epsilon [Spirochaetia bacterium]|nr:DNA polymerase III subunit epsilon [Spirochaetia bacterium]